MSKALLIFTAALLVCVNSTFGADVLSEKRLNAIIASPHSDKLTEPALKIYPLSRHFDVTMTNALPDGRSATISFKATDKWVDGRFIVSEAQPAGPETKFHLIVEYDTTSKTYRKYVVMAGKQTGYQVGTRVGTSRSVAWIDLSAVKVPDAIDCLSTETHTDTASTWHAIYFQKGVLQRTETGEAKVLKP
ncbi:MAG: hypothetical protein K0Q55_938 [Verrucomicrobia bacterium]|jgi:hypothetical protein|nr:hypothetical protein [Verrucomicrobiota bacterium]